MFDFNPFDCIIRCNQPYIMLCFHLFISLIVLYLLHDAYGFTLSSCCLKSIINQRSSSHQLYGENEGKIYQYTGIGPPPMLAKLLGIRSSSGDEKRSNRWKNASKSRTKAKLENQLQLQDKPSSSSSSLSKNNKNSKYDVESRPELSIDELERQVIAKFGKKSSYMPSHEDEEDENDEVEEMKANLVKPNRKSIQQSRFRKMNEPSSSSSSSKDDITVKSLNQDNDDDNMIDDDTVDDINGLTDEQQSARRKLFDRMKQHRSSSSPLASSSSLQPSSSSQSSSSSSSTTNVDTSYRFRKPPASAIAAEAEMQRQAIIKNKIKDDDHQAKIIASKLRSKEESKTDFIPFDFTYDDDDNDNDMMHIDDNIFSSTSFEKLGVVDPVILKNIDDMGIFVPTKIQEQIIPILSSSDQVSTVMQAMTGSGKTLGYLLPLSSIIDTSLDKVQTIIIAPSRELVLQIEDVAMKIFAGTGIRTQAIIGGANVRNQIRILREERPHLIVATPGRLAEIVFGLEKLGFGMVKAVIVDEVDHMLDEPFIGELETILQAIPIFNPKDAFSSSSSSDMNEDDNADHPHKNHNSMKMKRRSYVCFASATGNNPIVKKFTEKFPKLDWMMINGNTNNNPISSSSSSSNNVVKLLPSTITHALISTPRIRALEYLRRFLNTKPIVKSALIFVNDPHRVELLCQQLLEMNMIAAPLHGDSSKDDRKEIIARLRDNRINIVVTTELAARGIDIPNLTHVINFELPTDMNHYVHRAGRCGRAGRQGLVMNFANPKTKFVVRRFGKQLRIKMRDAELREGSVYLRTT